MYAMVRKVVTPPTTSARIVPPCSLILKNRSIGGMLADSTGGMKEFVVAAKD
jgi:hypothetical protein